MAATIPYTDYGKLVFRPRPNLANGSASNFDKVAFDPNHYRRAMTQCRGRGLSNEQCVEKVLSSSSNVDTYIAPANPLLHGDGKAGESQASEGDDQNAKATGPAAPYGFQKEVLDAVGCMNGTGDVAKCQHYLEVLHRRTHPEEIPGTDGDGNKLPSSGAKLGAALGSLGPSLILVPPIMGWGVPIKLLA